MSRSYNEYVVRAVQGSSSPRYRHLGVTVVLETNEQRRVKNVCMNESKQIVECPGVLPFVAGKGGRRSGDPGGDGEEAAG